MSANNNDSSIQTSSSLTLTSSLTKKINEDNKRKKSPFTMQKELFLNHSELLAKYSQGSRSFSPIRKRVTDKINQCAIDLLSSHRPFLSKRKKVTFKSNFIEIINVISYKKYYIEEEKDKQQHKLISRCNCFIL